MIGSNELKLNGPTMRLAVEEYLNRRALSNAQIEVTSVTQHGTADSPFTVWVKPRATPEKK